MGQMPQRGTATLERWEGERRDHHRALLLFAIQVPGQQSNRRVALAMGRSESGIRKLRMQRGWDARVASQEEPDVYALGLYREQYMAEFGQLELPEIVKNCQIPLGNPDPKAPSDAIAEAIHKAEAPLRRHMQAQAAVEHRVVEAIRDRAAERRAAAERHLRLVDGAIGGLARKLKADELRYSVRDIPVLLECREALVAAIEGEHHTGHGPVVESARVQHARETGLDVVDAMHQDAQELVSILGALQARKGVDVHELSAREAERRAEEQAERS